MRLWGLLRGLRLLLQRAPCKEGEKPVSHHEQVIEAQELARDLLAEMALSVRWMPLQRVETPQPKKTLGVKTWLWKISWKIKILNQWLMVMKSNKLSKKLSSRLTTPRLLFDIFSTSSIKRTSPTVKPTPSFTQDSAKQSTIPARLSTWTILINWSERAILRKY